MTTLPIRSVLLAIVLVRSIHAEEQIRNSVVLYEEHQESRDISAMSIRFGVALAPPDQHGNRNFIVECKMYYNGEASNLSLVGAISKTASGKTIVTGGDLNQGSHGATAVRIITVPENNDFNLRKGTYLFGSIAIGERLGWTSEQTEAANVGDLKKCFQWRQATSVRFLLLGDISP